MPRPKPVTNALAAVIVLLSSWGDGGSAVAQPRTHDVEIRKVYLECEKGADLRLVVTYRHDTDRVRSRLRGHGAAEGTRWHWRLELTTGTTTTGAVGMEVKGRSYWSSGVLGAPDPRRHVTRARVEGARGESCSGVYRAGPRGS